MGRMIIGGYGNESLTFNMGDSHCQAIQEAVLGRLASGKGLFFRYAGTRDEGDPVLSVSWIGPSTPVRFEYDTEVLPKLDREMADGYQQHVDSFGGIILASQAERAQWAEEERVPSCE